MKTIQLTQGKVTKVDDEDFEYLSQWKWYAHRNKKGSWYAVRSTPRVNGKQEKIRMHRAILNVTDPLTFIDHKDHDTLNNQKVNLRKCNGYENMANRLSAKNSTSKYLGVYFSAKNRRYIAVLQKEMKKVHIGSFKTEEEAAKAYDKKAIELHGKFANLNFK